MAEIINVQSEAQAGKKGIKFHWEYNAIQVWPIYFSLAKLFLEWLQIIEWHNWGVQWN